MSNAGVQPSARSLDVRIGGALLLHQVDLAVEAGTLVGLIGPNGAGKSTLLRTLAGLVAPSAGEVCVGGTSLRRLPAGERARRMALILQHPPETHGFTSIELVLTGRYPHLRRMEIEGPEDRAMAREAMHQTATAQFESRAVSSLSGGERQRLFIARGLAQQSPVLLLDEPTASLDVRHQLAMFELFRSLAEGGRTLVVAVHDLELAARYCHRLVLMDEGRIVTTGDPRDVLTSEHLSEVFQVSASVYRDPNNGALRVTFDPVDAPGGDTRGSGTGSGDPASARGGRHV